MPKDTQIVIVTILTILIGMLPVMSETIAKIMIPIIVVVFVLLYIFLVVEKTRYKKNKQRKKIQEVE